MNATISISQYDGHKPETARAEISGLDLNSPKAEREFEIYHRVLSRHALEISKELAEAFDAPEETEESEWSETKTDGTLSLNLQCGWLDTPIRTGIFNKRTGREYILSGYYEDADGNRHFTHPEALEIWRRTPGWGPCTDEFHRDLADALWDDDEDEWKENVCGTLLNGFDYLTKVLRYELGGYRYGVTGALMYVGNFGYSWSRSVSGSDGFFLSSNTQNLTPSYTAYRANGLQVRCLQE